MNITRMQTKSNIKTIKTITRYNVPQTLTEHATERYANQQFPSLHISKQGEPIRETKNLPKEHIQMHPF